MTDCQEEIRGMRKELKRLAKEVQERKYQGYSVMNLEDENEKLRERIEE